VDLPVEGPPDERHTIEPQGLQVIEGWMGKHGCPFNGSNRRVAP
jgi:hypothetical protein